MARTCPLLKKECLQSDCEWYDWDAKMCSMRALSGELDYVGSRLNEIRMEIASRGMFVDEEP